ncbi:MAG: hypothetical protein U0744_21120 [Gemmataceae bacterium]
MSLMLDDLRGHRRQLGDLVTRRRRIIQSRLDRQFGLSSGTARKVADNVLEPIDGHELLEMRRMSGCPPGVLPVDFLAGAGGCDT